MTRDERIIDWINGRSFANIAALAVVVYSLMAHKSGIAVDSPSTQGVLYDGAAVVPDNLLMSCLTNSLCLVLIASLLIALNRVFNFVRSTTHVMATTFLLLSLTSPMTIAGLNAGTMLCLVFEVCTFAMFGSYMDKQSQRGIFLTFAIISTGTMFHYAFLLLVPVFIIGCINMRIVDLRGVLAMLIGLLLPYWLVFGLGIAGFADVKAPDVTGVWQTEMTTQQALFVGTLAVTVVLALLLVVANLMKLLNFRLQIRVYNASFVWTTLLTVAATVVDYNHVWDYLPLLHVCVAVQVAHAFTMGRHPKRHLLFTILLLAAVAVTASNIIRP